MSENFKEKAEKETPRPASGGGESSQARRRGKQAPSLFGPIVLIAIGLFFLLNNLGVLPAVQFNWATALQLWPLFLILLGLNLIVRQAPSPVGGFLSAMVGITAVAIFGYVLLFSEDNPWLAQLGLNTTPAEATTEQLAFSAAGVQSAEVDLSLGAARVTIFPLEDNSNLLEGQVSYLGDLDFNAQVEDSQATVTLQDQGMGLFWLNPANWGSFNLDPWEIGLNPNVPLDLKLSIGAGSSDLNLAGLMLRSLAIHGGAGSMVLHLPDGDYRAMVDIGAGSTRITLAENGRQQIEIDGGAGGLTLLLPPGREARIEVDKGAGGLNLDRARFTQVQGRSDKEGVWETAGYQSADDPLDIKIDIGAGSVNVRQP